MVSIPFDRLRIAKPHLEVQYLASSAHDCSMLKIRSLAIIWIHEVRGVKEDQALAIKGHIKE
jgi:hypothetical protein